MALAGVEFPREGRLFLGLDRDGHTDVGEVLLEGDDVLVKQADAALAGAAGDGVLVVGAAVDADAAVAGRLQPEEPVSVGLDVAATVLEVVAPRGCVLNHGDLEGLADGRLGRALVAAPLLVALVLAHAAWELCHKHSVAVGIAVIDAERQVALADDDERGAGGLVGHGRQL